MNKRYMPNSSNHYHSLFGQIGVSEITLHALIKELAEKGMIRDEKAGNRHCCSLEGGVVE